MKKEIKYSNKELALAQVPPHELSNEEKKQADKQIWEIRKKRLQEMDSDKVSTAELMRLKLKMDKYIASSNYDEQYTFSYFLNEYINSLKQNKQEFSKEISLHNTQLSRLLHNKEEPNKNIFIRLEIHSNKSIPALIWFRVFEKQRELELINDAKLWKTEEKKVRKTFRKASI